MNKNTLYITFDGLSDPLGQSQILPYVCGLAQSGFHVNVLSCEKKERLRKEKTTILSAIDKLPISWNYILYDAEGGMLSRFFYILRIWNLARKTHRKKNIELVHCRSYLASLIGLAFKRRFKIPFVFDMRGFWADERLDGGIWKEGKPIEAFFYSYFKKKEKQFLSESDAVISLTHAGLKELNAQFPKNNLDERTTIIPCCTNTDKFSRKAVKPVDSLVDVSSNDHVLIYTGSIGTWYYTKEMIDCILIWKQLIPNLKLLILTKDAEELDKILTNYTLEQRKIIISASASYKDVPAYLSIAKAAIFFIKPAYSKIASSPTKMAECWAMGLPIITNSGIGDNDLYFNTNKGGVLVEGFSTPDYRSACQSYLSLSADPDHYRSIALNHFDTSMAIAKYVAIYKKLTAKS
ncbi:glycosyltransferase [Aurantibacillus circumpalustris]|uniref:glycosyltransferase n=1 Tax=Aurantibacillus circumpalustris TaxID=3036359 RepID=UPI00295BD46B|nr:glycosyltransferase [Aurantibacillus circumpalustris]